MADIVVTSPDEQPQLAVDVKNKSDTSQKWAAELYRNLAVHSALPTTRYFMLAALDRLFLWSQVTASHSNDPQYVVDATDLLKPYLQRAFADRVPISAQAFELIVSAWLTDLIRAEPSRSDKRFAWLFESGLFDAIRDGVVRTQVGL